LVVGNGVPREHGTGVLTGTSPVGDSAAPPGLPPTKTRSCSASTRSPTPGD
jgi:hypothetical protein